MEVPLARGAASRSRRSEARSERRRSSRSVPVPLVVVSKTASLRTSQGLDRSQARRPPGRPEAAPDADRQREQQCPAEIREPHP